MQHVPGAGHRALEANNEDGDESPQDDEGADALRCVEVNLTGCDGGGSRGGGDFGEGERQDVEDLGCEAKLRAICESRPRTYNDDGD